MNEFSFAAVVAIFWRQVQVLGSKLASLVFVRVKVYSPLCHHVATYCYKHYRRSPFGVVTYSADTWFVHPISRYQLVGYEQPSRDSMIFWKGWCPIMLSAMPDNNVGGVSEGQSITIVGLRGMLNAEELISVALKEFNSNAHLGTAAGRFSISRFQGLGSGRRDGNGNYPAEAKTVSSQHLGPASYRLLGWNQEDIGPERPVGKALDVLPFPDAVHTLVEELQRWLKSEDWYRSRGIPWRRGWLLYGRPGTGKTSLVRGIAQDMDLPVCVFDLSTMSNREMQQSWSEVLGRAPCIALLEDLDGVFEGRKNVSGEDGGGLTFDCLLNCLSGIEAANGIFLVVTTNRVELLDEALGRPKADSNGTMISTRPGRIDRALELLTMEATCRLILAKRILADCPEYIERLVGEGEGDTAAQFQERCAQIALADLWKA